MKTKKQNTGKIGEDIAVKFLIKQGFIILGRNYLKKFGEIDIICRKDQKIHFVEVKSVSRETPVVSTNCGTTGQAVSRETKDLYHPEDNIHPSKLQKIGRMIETYINEKDIREGWVFDVVTVVLEKDTKIAKVSFLQDLII